MTEKQKKSSEYIEHHILDLNPAFRLFPGSEPAKFNMFLTKFYRINSEFHEFEIHANILKILSEKLGNKTLFYDEHHYCSTDFLAFFWLKQQILRSEMEVAEEHGENLTENHPNLIKFINRMEKEFEKANEKIETLKISPPDHDFKLDHDGIPEEALHIEWRKDEDIWKALEDFKQRDSAILESKVRYKRSDTYLREPKRTRYIRFAISLGLLAFFWNLNKPNDCHPTIHKF
jgi:hypothetical protein